MFWFVQNVAFLRKLCYNRDEEGKRMNDSEILDSKQNAGANAEEKASDPAKKSAARNYHVSTRKEDGKWQVKFAGGEKAIKLFDTQVEAIAYAKKLAENRDGSITIHKKDGKMRKQRYWEQSPAGR